MNDYSYGYNNDDPFAYHGMYYNGYRFGDNVMFNQNNNLSFFNYQSTPTIQQDYSSSKLRTIDSGWTIKADDRNFVRRMADDVISDVRFFAQPSLENERAYIAMKYLPYAIGSGTTVKAIAGIEKTSVIAAKEAVGFFPEKAASAARRMAPYSKLTGKWVENSTTFTYKAYKALNSDVAKATTGFGEGFIKGQYGVDYTWKASGIQAWGRAAGEFVGQAWEPIMRFFK